MLKTYSDKKDGKRFGFENHLGEFTYDDTQFQLNADVISKPVRDSKGNILRDENGNIIRKDHVIGNLRYIGKETDGRKIKIPDGIRDCNMMFAGTSLYYAPMIPDEVQNCNFMFCECRNLKYVHSDAMPAGALYTSGMFYNCSHLVEAPRLNKCLYLRDTSSMYEGCSTLKSLGPTKLPLHAEVTRRMFKDCTSLNYIDGVFAYITDCKSMFENCSNLRKTAVFTFAQVPNVDDKVIDCDNMFSGCSKLGKVQMGISHRRLIPKLSCNSMFKNCRSLSLVSGCFIPDGVSHDMFTGCFSMREEYKIYQRIADEYLDAHNKEIEEKRRATKAQRVRDYLNDIIKATDVSDEDYCCSIRFGKYAKQYEDGFVYGHTLKFPYPKGRTHYAERSVTTFETTENIMRNYHGSDIEIWCTEDEFNVTRNHGKTKIYSCKADGLSFHDKINPINVNKLQTSLKLAAALEMSGAQEFANTDYYVEGKTTVVPFSLKDYLEYDFDIEYYRKDNHLAKERQEIKFKDFEEKERSIN